MGTNSEDEQPEGSRLRRVADHPLVILVVGVAAYLLAIAAGVFVGGTLPPLAPLATLILRYAIVVLFGVLIYKFFIARLGRTPRDDLGTRGAGRDLGLGIAGGAALMALVVAIAALANVYNVVGSGNSDDLPKILIAAAIVPGIMEEIFFRGILFRWIEAFAGSWAALALTSALFGLAHVYNPNATWFSTFAIAVEAGILLGGAYMLTRSLWAPIGLHFAWNLTQALFDVPVSGVSEQGLVDATLTGPALLSGGPFGLEASVIALAVAGLSGVLLVRAAARCGHVVAPSWSDAPPRTAATA